MVNSRFEMCCAALSFNCPWEQCGFDAKSVQKNVKKLSGKGSNFGAFAAIFLLFSL